MPDATSYTTLLCAPLYTTTTRRAEHPIPRTGYLIMTYRTKDPCAQTRGSGHARAAFATPKFHGPRGQGCRCKVCLPHMGGARPVGARGALHAMLAFDMNRDGTHDRSNRFADTEDLALRHPRAGSARRARAWPVRRGASVFRRATALQPLRAGPAGVGAEPGRAARALRRRRRHCRARRAAGARL